MKCKKLLLFLLPILCSCEVEKITGPDNENSATIELCRYIWTIDYIDYDDTRIQQRYIFDANYTGREIITYSRIGQTTSDEYHYNWSWNTDSYTSLCLDYGNNNLLFMDGVFISGDYFTCRIGGDEFMFYGQPFNY